MISTGINSTSHSTSHTNNSTRKLASEFSSDALTIERCSPTDRYGYTWSGKLIVSKHLKAYSVSCISFSTPGYRSFSRSTNLNPILTARSSSRDRSKFDCQFTIASTPPLSKSSHFRQLRSVCVQHSHGVTAKTLQHFGSAISARFLEDR